MTQLKEQIFCKISHISFKDGQKLLDFISGLVIKNGDVGFVIDISGRDVDEATALRLEAKQRIEEIPAVGKVTIALTSSKKEDSKAKLLIEGAGKVILVAAGKGGVGKSTVTALLAQNLSKKGCRVGVLDADIYGPSIPLIFGARGKPEIVDKKMMPLVAQNIQINSIGFLTPEDQPIAWRGPMASKAIYQLMSLTAWQDLDYLFIDMPPGTGDIHLSLLENYQINGGVIMVTTPQKVSAVDVAKAMGLYRKYGLEFLGIIENMSYFYDRQSGEKVEIFQGSSGRRLAEDYNIPFLAEIPISPELALACDLGTSLPDVLSLADLIRRLSS